MINGKFFRMRPYPSHKQMPTETVIYISIEIFFVSLLLTVLMVCGKKETVVRNAATNPSVVIQSMLC